MQRRSLPVYVGVRIFRRVEKAVPSHGTVFELTCVVGGGYGSVAGGKFAGGEGICRVG